jgi:hypothetical protein
MPLGPRPQTVELAMTAVLGPSRPSGSQAFPVSTADGRRWYLKAPNNPQGGHVLATEYIVSQVRRIIGAPVCIVEPITVGRDFVGSQIVNGPQLVEGIGSASLEIPGVREMRPALEYRDQDDNARRHAGVYALFDWYWGDDQQWLEAEDDEHRLYSHDHGFYFPPGGAQWSAATVCASHGCERRML